MTWIVSPSLKPWPFAQPSSASTWSSRSFANASGGPCSSSGWNTEVIVLGSTPEAFCELPPPLMFAWSNRIGETTSTPSTPRSFSATSGEIGEKPSSWVTISAERLNCSSMTLSTDPLRPAAKIAVNTTSASPIMSAEAVIAVRCGWRSAFSRASRPGIPWNRSSGAPMKRASGRTSTGASSATPNIITTTPSPSSAAAAEPSAPNRPSSSATRPSPITVRRSRAACG